MLPRDLSCEKAQHEEKSANFGTKVPVKRRKTGSFSAKVAHLRTPLGFLPSELPFHGLIRPRFLRPVRTSARSLRTSTGRCGRCLGHATRCYAKCSRRSHGEGRSLGIARPHARRHPVHRRQPRKNAVHDREAVWKMPLDKRAHAQVDSNCGNGRTDAPRLFEKCRRTGGKRLSNITFIRKTAFRPPGPLSARGKKLHKTIISAPHTAIIHTENQNIQHKTPPRHIKFNEGGDEASTLSEKIVRFFLFPPHHSDKSPIFAPSK